MQFDVACIVHLSIWICMDLYVFVEKHNVISCHAFFENAQLLQVVPGRECLTFAELSQVVVFCRNVSYFIAKLTPRSHLRRNTVSFFRDSFTYVSIHLLEVRFVPKVSSKSYVDHT